MVPLKIKIPDGFLEDEVRWDYLVTKQMKEVWAVLLDIVSEFDRVCRKNGIQYYLCSGSLLGAIRHKGFIPWDDDIDLVVLREDYDKLLLIADKEFSHPYFFQTAFNDPGYQYGYAHLRRSDTTGMEVNSKKMQFKFNQGIKIDIFPLDTVVGDEALYENQLTKADRLLRKANFFYGATKEGIYWHSNFIVRLFRKILSVCMSRPMRRMGDNAFRKFDNLCKKYNGTESDWLASITTVRVLKKKCVKFPKEHFQNTTYLPFEFIQLPVGNNYEKILGLHYGDWKIPIKGTAIHGHMIFDTDNSYKKYL